MNSQGSLADSLIAGQPLTRAIWYTVLALLGTLLIAVAAKTKVPMWPVDMSLQTLAVLTIAATFGTRLGLATILLYLAEGAMGLPVFQGTPERGIGLAYMAGPTGGYLVGYVVMVAMVGWAADRGWGRQPLRLFGVMLAGGVLLLVFGAIWLAVLFGINQAFAYGIGPFIVTDLIKTALAAALVPALWGLTGRLRSRDAE